MNLSEYTSRLRAAAERASTLRQHIGNANVHADCCFEQAVEELYTALEELRVAEEEMYQQDEALAQAQEKTQREHQRYKTLFEFAPDGYLITNLDGCIQSANQSAAEMLHVQQRYLQRKPLTIYIAHEEQATFCERLHSLRTSYTPERWQTQLRPRTSPIVEVLITAVRNVSGTEEANGEILWQLRDITELKRKEANEREQFFRTTFEQSAVGMAHVGPAGQWLRVNWKLCQILGYSSNELKQKTYRDVTFEEDLPISDEIHRQLMSGETLNRAFEKRHLRKDGSFVWTRVTASSIHAETGKFLYNIVVIEDISERKQIEAAEREQRLLAEALHDTAIAVNSSLLFSEVIDHILTALGRVVPHEAAVLMLAENDIAYVVRTKGYAENGLPELKEALLRFRVPIQDSSILRHMQQTKKPLLLSHRNDQRYWDSLPDMPAIRSCVGAPILVRDEVIGFLKLHSQKPGFFTEQHAQLLEAFAAQAAIAIQNARSYEQAQTLAVMRDRQRLARDLHDDVTQALFSANVLAESLPRLWNNIPAKVSERINQLQMLTRGALAEMRTLLLELRPEHLSNIDLQTQLQQLVDALKARKRIQVDLQIQDKTPLPSEVRVAFYRIAQEVLNNVAKHARAEHVDIALDASSEYAHLVIRDNGIGFDLQSEISGLGLHIIHERAEEIGAHLEIISQPNTGTMVSLFWQPIPDGVQRTRSLARRE